MPDEPIPLPKAARLLGLTPEAVRQRIRRGELEAFRDNRGRWQVVLAKGDQQDLPTDSANADQIVELKAELARWQERVDGLAKRLADRDRELGEVKFERDKLLAMLDDVLAERRRPWPGLKAWWRRVIHGGEDD